MDFQDKKLICRDCNKEFVWTAGEQKFFAEKGFANAPTRCPDDRKKFKEQKKSGKNLVNITCKNCGKQGQVPFTPRDANDILCSDCFYQSKEITKTTGEPPEPQTADVPEDTKTDSN